jgi:hypothetical protein
VAASTSNDCLSCARSALSLFPEPVESDYLTWGYSMLIDRSMGILCKQTISLNSNYSHRDYLLHLRRISFKEPEHGKTHSF